MHPFHEPELAYLNECYEQEGSRLLVVYGKKNVGKTALFQQFLKEKHAFFYQARTASEKEQIFRWGMELGFGDHALPSTYEALFGHILAFLPEKSVLFINDFTYLLRPDGTFFKALCSFLEKSHEEGNQILVLLVSSHVAYIENSLIGKLGSSARRIDGFLKIRELPFYRMHQAFPTYSKEDAVLLYTVLGGNPGLWEYFDPSKSFRDNFCQTFGNPHSGIISQIFDGMQQQLREMSVYQTILAELADGNYKLNELYVQTGFSRAKISVYLKHLMELEVVEKSFSLETEGHSDTKKGIYRIADAPIHFYFTFLYPNMSAFRAMPAEAFYDKYISKRLKAFAARRFPMIGLQTLRQWNEDGKLPFTASQFGKWEGKLGTIDLVLQGEEETLVGLCSYTDEKMRFDDYEWLLFCAEKAKLSTDYVYLISTGGFDHQLLSTAKEMEQIKLLTLEDI